MQPILRTIKKHPFALFAYIAYVCLLINQVRLHFRFAEASSHINSGERVAWGEGMIYGWLLLVSLGIGTGIVMLINAMLYKDNRLFYLSLGLGFIVPMLVIGVRELNS